jgi:hypothetical protein
MSSVGAPALAALVEQRDDLALEQVEQRVRLDLVALGEVVDVSADEIAQPFSPSKHSSHQPSRIEQFSPPLSAAFMPLVPQASWGRRGVFSHTSQPW